MTQSTRKHVSSPTSSDAPTHVVYEIVRARIVHEDDLINQRLMWMITFNGLLFTAYGFSLSAEAGSLTALAPTAGLSAPTADQKFAYESLKSAIEVVRNAMAWVGILSSLAAFFGVVAANRAIRNDQRFFRRHLNTLSTDYPRTHLPPIIGKWSTNALGMASSLAVPFLVSGAWLWTLQKYEDKLLLVFGFTIALVGILLIWVLKEDTPDDFHGEA